MNMVYVDGETRGDIILYAISTCGWCKKTKSLLNRLGVQYRYIYVDLLGKEEKERITNEVKNWNPQCNYPTLVIDNKKCIIGFKEDEIREALQG